MEGEIGLKEARSLQIYMGNGFEPLDFLFFYFLYFYVSIYLDWSRVEAIE